MTRYAFTFRNPQFLNKATGKPTPNDTGWQNRHMAAIRNPQGFEFAIVPLIEAWARYADAHSARYESGIGDDSVIGAAWESTAYGILQLLNGECGRLDCGTLDGFIRDTLKAEGLGDE